MDEFSNETQYPDPDEIGPTVFSSKQSPKLQSPNVIHYKPVEPKYMEYAYREADEPSQTENVVDPTEADNLVTNGATLRYVEVQVSEPQTQSQTSQPQTQDNSFQEDTLRALEALDDAITEDPFANLQQQQIGITVRRYHDGNVPPSPAVTSPPVIATPSKKVPIVTEKHTPPTAVDTSREKKEAETQPTRVSVASSESTLSTEQSLPSPSADAQRLTSKQTTTSPEPPSTVEQVMADLKRMDGVGSLSLIKNEKQRLQMDMENKARSDIERLKLEYTPQRFVSQVPNCFENGTPIPEWQRLMLAKKLSDRAIADREQRIWQNFEEWKEAQIPNWKKSLKLNSTRTAKTQ